MVDAVMSLDGAVKTLSGFCVAKDDLRRWRWEVNEASGGGDPMPGQILVGTTKFALRARRSDRMVLRPLFSISFFCAELLKEEHFFGVRQLIISSASSKTAVGLAFLVARGRDRRPDVVGQCRLRGQAWRVRSRG
jgi:Protein of unknown function (DUF2855)